mmetsp:Transcript_26576/g.83112  ORF Transcript_26576/g.83112 Transcript_26576/m.83112 type:complete len:299 (+) Transcript_26576:151-1047(+)
MNLEVEAGGGGDSNSDVAFQDVADAAAEGDAAAGGGKGGEGAADVADAADGADAADATAGSTTDPLRPVTSEDLALIMKYGPLALHFLYGGRSAVDTQLLARNQGWSLIFIEPDSTLNSPAFALFANKTTKVACLAVRGTATITDVVTDIRARPVKFPPELKDLDLPGWRPNPNPKEPITNAWQELAASTDGNAESMACLGMATAAEWLASETCTPLCQLAREGYEIVLTGHSLGAAVATLLGALLRGDGLLPDLAVVGFSTPACTSRFLAEQCRNFSRHVVLHDDVIPRITPRGLRG